MDGLSAITGTTAFPRHRSDQDGGMDSHGSRTALRTSVIVMSIVAGLLVIYALGFWFIYRSHRLQYHWEVAAEHRPPVMVLEQDFLGRLVYFGYFPIIRLSGVRVLWSQPGSVWN